jgi:proline iminopeptidase
MLRTAAHVRAAFAFGRYRVVLFDQRGCGSSTPRGGTDANDTWRLVEDIERLRVRIGAVPCPFY